MKAESKAKIRSAEPLLSANPIEKRDALFDDILYNFDFEIKNLRTNMYALSESISLIENAFGIPISSDEGEEITSKDVPERNLKNILFDLQNLNNWFNSERDRLSKIV